MHNRPLIALLFIAALAACGADAPENAPPPVASMASADAPLRFVGLWAVSEAMCAEPAWRFRAEEVSTLGEVHCAFTEVAPTADGYAINAMCTAEAPPAPYTISLSLTEAPRTMTISGGPWVASTQLVYCAPLPAE